jgi:hypothetical protein
MALLRHFEEMKLPKMGLCLPTNAALRRAPLRTLVACLLGSSCLLAQAATLNVADYGAIGDAVQFYGNSTSNSVVITTTNTLSEADIGKSIQVFEAGAITVAPECQDLIATITNVVNGTNLHVSFVAQRTLTNTFITVGTDNRAAIQAAIDAATGTNTIINIPAGKYLVLSEYVTNAFATVGLVLRGGGIHLVGAGRSDTTLLSQGAWQLRFDNKAARGFLIAIRGPVTNDYPVSIRDMTLDGGVEAGYTGLHSFPASVVTGDGWDELHSAINIRGTGNPFTWQTYSNLAVVRWRGEMLKSNDTTTNSFLTITDCLFDDGNATAINIYPALTVTNCVFQNLFQIGEYYQAWSPNPSLFINNLCTNIYTAGFAINGARSNSPSFTFRGNTFSFRATNFSGTAISSTPGVNIYVLSNTFHFPSGNGSGVTPGTPGYQGYWMNSNIVVVGNTFIDPRIVIQINGGAVSADSILKTVGVYVTNNTLVQTFGGNAVNGLAAYTWGEDVWFVNNNFTNTLVPRVMFSSGLRGDPFANVLLNNQYYSTLYDLTGTTNFVSYGNGSRYKVIYGFQPATKYTLVTTNANQIPAGAQILIQNDNTSGAAIPVYLNSAMTAGPVSIPHRSSRTFSWTNGVWVSSSPIIPPANIRAGPGPTN